jgi:hypothetical protein
MYIMFEHFLKAIMLQFGHSTFGDLGAPHTTTAGQSKGSEWAMRY